MNVKENINKVVLGERNLSYAICAMDGFRNFLGTRIMVLALRKYTVQIYFDKTPVVAVG